ncbi:hypothetical protein PR202_ga28766 [Eleusine coracana subsp. coracana]|uniref:C3H1-type domain-containing protein n=1 Tax=Eleusine coracana subsp. coracana TaxID=191504 RepID=A0AAV5DJD2_ELECO|nr:hypothetical protein PR202_ga28766 [Eleusine coracana subsp. coracana]
MDAYEATKVVFSRIQALDPEHAAKIMGLLLIQDHGEKEMIRLAFGPEALLHTVMAKARKDLGLLPASGPGTPTSVTHSPSPFMLSRQNSGRCSGTAPSPLSVSSPSSWAPPPVFSKTNGGAAEEMAGLGEELMNGNGALFGRDHPELQLQDQLAFLNDAAGQVFDGTECPSPVDGGGGGFFPYGGAGGLGGWANGGGGHAHRRSSSVSELCLGGGDAWKPCLYYARGYCKNGSACRFVHGLPEDAAASLEQQCQDMLLRSKSQRLGFPTGSLPGSPSAAGNIYGPVHDVRIPYQQKRMFGFVTFVYPETVKLILAKGNPHFICDARVLVKPYKEKGKVPDKKQQLPGDRLDFATNGLDTRDPFDLHQLGNSLQLQITVIFDDSRMNAQTAAVSSSGARMLQHSNSANEMLLRRKLEEQQQQAAELQQAMELQSRRLMGLQLLGLKSRSPAPPSPIGVPFSPSRAVGSPTVESPPDSGGEQGKGTTTGFLLSQRKPVNGGGGGGGDKDESGGNASPNADSDQSAEHNLPDSPFASPTKSAAFAHDPFTPTELEISTAVSTGCNASYVGMNNGASNGGSLLTNHLRPSALDIPSPKNYFFPMSRYAQF